jgi:2-oxo-3-hexenedioate decarboxylase
VTTLSIPALARRLDEARRGGRAIPRLTVEHPTLTLEDAYRVQEDGLRLRTAGGERVVGYKMGLTSKAKMRQMGVDTPIMGILTDAMRVESGARFSLKGLIHPRIEPEIAFVLGRVLRGRVSAAEALAACSGVCAAMEILDSRFVDFRFELADVVADDTSACGYVLGPLVPARALKGLKMEIAVDGKTAQSGLSDAIYGDPAESLAELSSMLHARGKSLPAGSVVLAGAATAAIPLTAGARVETAVESLGAVSVVASA